MVRLQRFKRTLDAVWLFPPTYLVHLIEEYFAGDGFPVWAERALGIRFTQAEFVVWNAFALAVMCVAAWLVTRDPKFRFLEISMAIAVLGNVAAHVLGSLVTWTYSPGLVSGVVVWGPVGVIRLRSARQASTEAARRAGIYLGLAIVLITVVVATWGTIFTS